MVADFRRLLDCLFDNKKALPYFDSQNTGTRLF